MNWIKYPVIGLYGLCCGLAVLFLMGMVIPLAFLRDCSVENNTQEDIWITPVGTVGQQGTRSLLPLYRGSFPHFRLLKLGHFRVSPGEVVHFSYDMDDINFSELVIESKSGQTGQLVVNPNPTANQYISPSVTDFVVDDLNALLPVPENVRNTALTSRSGNRLWIIYLIFAIPVIVEPLRFLYRYKHKRRQQQVS